MKNINSMFLFSEKINYSRNEAANYANKYYMKYNSKYPNFGDNHYEGGDCANFVSQCLYIGGMKWVEKNSYYDRVENWWCKKGATDKDGDRRITLSWKTTYGFKNHWKNRASKYYSNTVISMKNNWNKWYGELSRGDAIQLANKYGNPWHTMIICYYANNDFKLASHTKDTNSALFREYILEQKMKNNQRILIYKIV